MNRKKNFAITLLILTSSCGDVLTGLNDSDSENSYISSALALVVHAMNTREEVAPFWATAWSVSPFATCSSGVTRTNCSSAKTRQFTYNNCSGSMTGSTYSGALNLSFSRADCSTSLAEDDTITVQSTSFMSTSVDSTSILWLSTPLTTYAGTSISGGYRITEDSSSQFYLNVLGFTRQRKKASGSAIYEHSIRSSSQMIVGTGHTSGLRSATGAINVHSNLAQFTASLTFASVQWQDLNCCHPTSGTIDVAFGGTKSGTASFEFEGVCGKMKNTTSSELITLDACN